ncbi:hypothetical protein OMR07_04835 [Methylobacterium organophilum]|nr:hypothetical protein [Methylobacterium organophilum]
MDDRTELRAHATAWLSSEGRFASDAGALLEGLSAALIEFGLLLDRATFHAPTLHPSHRG